MWLNLLFCLQICLRTRESVIFRRLRLLTSESFLPNIDSFFNNITNSHVFVYYKVFALSTCIRAASTFDRKISPNLVKTCWVENDATQLFSIIIPLPASLAVVDTILVLVKMVWSNRVLWSSSDLFRYFFNEVGESILILLFCFNLVGNIRFGLSLVAINSLVKVFEVKVALRGTTVWAILIIWLLISGVISALYLFICRCQLLDCEILPPVLKPIFLVHMEFNRFLVFDWKRLKFLFLVLVFALNHFQI